jgi:hypothetical protein
VNQLVDAQVISGAGSRHQKVIDKSEFIPRATGVGNKVVASGRLIFIPRCKSSSTNARIIKVNHNMHAAVAIMRDGEDSMNFANEVDNLSGALRRARYRDRCEERHISLKNHFRVTGQRKEQRDHCRYQRKGFCFHVEGRLPAQWWQYGSSRAAQLIGIHRHERRDLPTEMRAKPYRTAWNADAVENKVTESDI